MALGEQRKRLSHMQSENGEVGIADKNYKKEPGERSASGSEPGSCSRALRDQVSSIRQGERETEKTDEQELQQRSW
jgi:hypothetical protein